MICIDASVAAKRFFPEVSSAEASGLLRTALDTLEPIVAPPRLPVEVTNIIRQRLRKGTLAPEDGRTILTQFLTIPIDYTVPDGLYERALMLSNEFDLPAVYDAHYVAHAELRGTTVWTADQRLLSHLSAKLAFVRSIADWQPPHDVE